MRILLHSTTPWGPSSYSVLTRRAVPPMIRDGYDVIVSTWYGLQGEPQTWRIKKYTEGQRIALTAAGLPDGDETVPVTILPSVEPSSYGIDVLLANYERHKCDVLITNMDVWVCNPSITSRTRFAPWFPIDHDPVPPAVLSALAPAVYPMVYSRWGVDVLAKAGVEAHYVPCGAPASVFTPMAQSDARKALGVSEDGFLGLMVAANKDPDDRKGFSEALQAFARFAAKHDDARLLVHTNWGGPVSIAALSERLGIADKILRPDPYAYVMGLYPESYMRQLYSAADVLLNPSKSEGFGLPLIEAQMCGCPVISTDFSTARELTGAGWCVPGQLHWTIGADSWRMTVNVDALTDILEDANSLRGNAAFREQARTFAVEYDTQTVHDRYWRPALKEIDELVAGNAGDLQLVTF